MIKREQILIRCGRTKAPIDAEVYGAFAVNPPPFADASYWRRDTSGTFRVTHLGTGYFVCETSKTKARKIANELNTFISAGDFTDADVEARTEIFQAFVAQAKPFVKGQL